MKNTEHMYRAQGEEISITRGTEQVGVIKTPMAKGRISDLITSLGNTLVPKRDS